MQSAVATDLALSNTFSKIDYLSRFLLVIVLVTSGTRAKLFWRAMRLVSSGYEATP